MQKNKEEKIPGWRKSFQNILFWCVLLGIGIFFGYLFFDESPATGLTQSKTHTYYVHAFTVDNHYVSVKLELIEDEYYAGWEHDGIRFDSTVEGYVNMFFADVNSDDFYTSRFALRDFLQKSFYNAVGSVRILEMVGDGVMEQKRKDKEELDMLQLNLGRLQSKLFLDRQLNAIEDEYARLLYDDSIVKINNAMEAGRLQSKVDVLNAETSAKIANLIGASIKLSSPFDCSQFDVVVDSSQLQHDFHCDIGHLKDGLYDKTVGWEPARRLCAFEKFVIDCY